MASVSGAGFSGSDPGPVVGLPWLPAGEELSLVDDGVLNGSLVYYEDKPSN